ncbi:MAG: nucleotidyltransferase family protein [Desulfovibrio sp.]|jgi:dTDP-glucose pyrophosphorylase|nr:nucleotidyltransferase family protein [Desulfovibrio sp.]
MKWEKIIVQPTVTILQALEAIDRGAIQLAIVCDGDRHVLGIITDGDVRRALLRGIAVSDPAIDAVNTRPFTVRVNHSKAEALQIMRKNDFRHILVVDDENHFIDLLTLQELLQFNIALNPVVLMAGGKGSRLGNLTRDCPKPMLPVGGKPILEIIIENFISEGFHDFYLCVNYHADVIQEHFGDGSRLGVSIRYIREDKPLGTAGALSLLPSSLSRSCLVMNGDILTRMSPRALLEAHDDSGCEATMAVKVFEYQVPYGVVIHDPGRRVVRIEEKPSQRFLVNAGIYAFSPRVFCHVPRDTFYDMPAFFRKLAEEGHRTAIFDLDDYWVDIGRIADYRKAAVDFGNIFPGEE